MLCLQKGLSRLLTFNLHILNCRLSKQETARGATSKDMELWTERLIQVLCRDVKYTSTRYPEQARSDCILALAAARHHRRRCPHQSRRTLPPPFRCYRCRR